jgi:hypothetical protein
MKLLTSSTAQKCNLHFFSILELHFKQLNNPQAISLAN